MWKVIKSIIIIFVIYSTLKFVATRSLAEATPQCYKSTGTAELIKSIRTEAELAEVEQEIKDDMLSCIWKESNFLVGLFFSKKELRDGFSFTFKTTSNAR